MYNGNKTKPPTPLSDGGPDAYNHESPNSWANMDVQDGLVKLAKEKKCSTRVIIKDWRPTQAEWFQVANRFPLLHKLLVHPLRPYAPDGRRPEARERLVGTLAKYYPYLSPEALQDLFRPALEAQAALPGEPEDYVQTRMDDILRMWFKWAETYSAALTPAELDGLERYHARYGSKTVAATLGILRSIDQDPEQPLKGELTDRGAIDLANALAAKYPRRSVRCIAETLLELNLPQDHPFTDRVLKTFQARLASGPPVLVTVRRQGKEEQGLPFRNTGNWINALVETGVPVWYNTRSGKTHVASILPWEDDPLTTVQDRVLDDKKDVAGAIRYYWNTYCLEGTSNVVWDAITAVAMYDSRDPVRDWLNALEPWDGKQRLFNFLQTYANVPDNLLFKLYWVMWMIGTVKRVYEPGCAMPFMPVLVGPTGCGKSQLVERLVPNSDWCQTFSMDKSNPTDVVDQFHRSGAWVMEFKELSGMNKRTNEFIKSLIGESKDQYRESYGRSPEVRLRKVSMIGTSNDQPEGLLFDPTSSRRTVMIPIKKDIVDDITSLVPQLYAEALYYYKRGDSCIPTREMEREIETSNEPYKKFVVEHDDTFDKAAQEVLKEKNGECTVRDVIQAVHVACGLADPSHKRNERRAATALKKLGCTKRQAWVNGIKVVLWSIPKEE